MMNASEAHPIRKPFPRSYWVVPGLLLAGCYPGSLIFEEAEMKLSGLVACGIGRVITLMEEDERDWLGKPFIPYGSRLHALAAAAGRPIEVVRHPIRDGGVPTPERMRIILDDIKASHARGTPVYVHCWGGKGRTGTVVGCFLMRCGMAESESVLDMIDRMRREDPKRYDPSPENDRQREMVTFWRERS